ncbi:MAG: putative porin [Bdellovibrionales bacterium]
MKEIVQCQTKLFFFLFVLWAPDFALAQEKPPVLADIKFNGDFRYRHQATKSEAEPDRFRDRIRLRLGARFEIEPGLHAQVRLATGQSGDNALSTNQSLGSGAEKKSLWIDQAFLKWQPGDAWDVRLGKISNLWWEPGDLQFLFDEDYTPDGLAVEWKHQTLQTQFFLSGHAHWLKERSDSSPPETSTDVALLAVQAGWQWVPSKHQVTLALGYMAIPNLRGTTALNNDEEFSGNSFVTVLGEDVYAYDYDVLSLSGEWVYSGGLREPVTFEMSATDNLRRQKQNRSVTAGVIFGHIEQKGDWLVGYRYRYAEADALFAGLSDSDLGEATDARGHVGTLKYGLSDKVSLSATYYRYQLKLSRASEDWQRLHLDLVARF